MVSQMHDVSLRILSPKVAFYLTDAHVICCWHRAKSNCGVRPKGPYSDLKSISKSSFVSSEIDICMIQS